MRHEACSKEEGGEGSKVEMRFLRDSGVGGNKEAQDKWKLSGIGRREPMGYMKGDAAGNMKNVMRERNVHMHVPS